MNILVVGCGKVGSRLAQMLSDEGHDVSIVDNDEESFDRLEADFGGYKTVGVPIDQDVLRSAGIENCDAVVAVSPDDNVNIMVSEVARKSFNIKTVIARIYDIERGDVFSHFGLYTVCPTNLTVSSIISALNEENVTQKINIGPRTITFAVEEVTKALSGITTEDIELSDKQSLYSVLHGDGTMEFYKGDAILLKEGDKVILSTLVD